MTKKSKKIIIFLVILVLIGFFVFILLQSSDSFEGEGVLVSSNQGLGISTSQSGELVRSEAFFLQQINRLREVTFNDVEILSSDALNSLEDNTVVIPEFERGRDNPFSRIGARARFESEISTSQNNDNQETETPSSGQPSSVPVTSTDNQNTGFTVVE